MQRRDFVKLLASAPLIYTGMQLQDLKNMSSNFANSARMPVLFIGHGHPMNALYDNSFTRKLVQIGQEIEKPNAIMLISAHWETQGTFVSLNPQPKAIYDFGGFDERLYQQKYEPIGHPALAQEIITLGQKHGIQGDAQMGLDHGAWTVLKHIYPNADVPVFQMSIDYTRNESYHFKLAAALKAMRDKGVLILCSGNIVHNLGILDWRNQDAKPFEWAFTFDELVKSKLDTQDFKSLVEYQQFGKIAQMAIPSNEHYVPMIYSLGLAYASERVEHLYEEIHYGSISMRCFKIS
jgi:4,5-DOPA dioxygenase extradiol